MLLQPADVVFAFCPTGEGGGVDPTCPPANAGKGVKPKTATGSSTWPEDVRKKLRSLQSRLSRAKTVEAKAAVVLAINALIAEQSGVKVPAQPAGSRMSAKEALLEAAKHVPIKYYTDETPVREYEGLNVWALNKEEQTGTYWFKVPSGRSFEMRIESGELMFHDDEMESTMTGMGEAHHVFGEVTKAVTALATKTSIPSIRFTADAQSKGRQKLYGRLAKSLAALVPGAKTKTLRQRPGTTLKYITTLRQDRSIAFAFCPTGEGGGVDPTCSPASAGSAAPRVRRPRQRRPGQPLRVNEWPEVDRRKLRALQSRLSRAVGEPAKAAVRVQIEALRARVQADADRAAAPVDRPGYRVLTEEIRANARTAATPAIPPYVMPPRTSQPAAAPKIRTQAEIEAHISNLTDAPEYDEGWRPLTQQLEQIYERGGAAEAGSTSNRTQLDAVMSSLFGSKGEDRANHAKLLLSAVGADKRITDKLNRADVQAVAIGSSTFLTMSLRGDGVALTRVLRNNSAGKYAENALFTLKDDMQGDGTGVRVFSQQVDSLANAGFQYIETTAARGGSYIGYKVWPKFGYDGELNNAQVTSAKRAGVYKEAYKDKSGRARGDFQATLETKEGQAWWTKYGEGKHLYFRLDDKKHASQSILKDYRENKIKALKEELKTAPVTAPAAEPAAAPATPSYTSLSPEQGARIRAAAELRAQQRARAISR